MTSFSHFLERLQNSDETTKRRWMIVATIVIMAVVVYIWMAYFNNLVFGISQVQQPPAAAGASGFTFWQTMKNGTAVIFQVFGGWANSLRNIFNAPKEYIVRPPIN